MNINEQWISSNGNKYSVGWCDLCDCAFIACFELNCHGSTCNAGGCDKCKDDFDEFNTYKTQVENYLTDEEKTIYNKCLRIKDFILSTIPRGDKQIDFKKLQQNGRLSKSDEKVFTKELN